MKPLTSEEWSDHLDHLDHLVSLWSSNIPLKNLNPQFTKQLEIRPLERGEILAKAFVFFDFMEKAAHPEQTPPFSFTDRIVKELDTEGIESLLQNGEDVISALVPHLSEEIPDETPFLSIDTFITTDGRTDTTTYHFRRDTFLLEEGGYNTFLKNVEIVKQMLSNT